MLDNGLIPGEIFQSERLIKELAYKPDFSNNKYVIEVKSVESIKDKTAYFAPSILSRTYRQLKALIKLREEGKEFIIIFILQSNITNKLFIWKNFDKDFYNRIITAKKLGIKFFAFNCNITMEGVFIKSLIKFFF